MAKSRESDPNPLKVFGEMLRHFRMAAGLSQAQLGARAYCSGDLVGKVESGDRPPTREFTVACDAVPELNTSGALTVLREQIKKHLRERVHPAWFDRWADVEEQAQALRWYEPLLVPGLLQTEDYARAVLATRPNTTEEQVEHQVAARLARQDILARDNPPHLWTVIDEGMLHREIGGLKVMHDQLLHLVDMSDRHKVSVQVIPFSAGARTGLAGAFIVADLDGDGSIVYLDSATAGRVVEAPSVVREVGLIFDTLRGEPLPRGASRDLIMKVAEERWT